MKNFLLFSALSAGLMLAVAFTFINLFSPEDELLTESLEALGKNCIPDGMPCTFSYECCSEYSENGFCMPDPEGGEPGGGGIVCLNVSAGPIGTSPVTFLKCTKLGCENIYSQVCVDASPSDRCTRTTCVPL